MKGDFQITRAAGGTWEGRVDLVPEAGELNHVYHDFEAALPPALQGFDGLYLAADGVRAKGRRDGVPFDVTVSLKPESG